MNESIKFNLVALLDGCMVAWCHPGLSIRGVYKLGLISETFFDFFFEKSYLYSLQCHPLNEFKWWHIGPSGPKVFQEALRYLLPKNDQILISSWDSLVESL